jgi:hypothetical protein
LLNKRAAGLIRRLFFCVEKTEKAAWSSNDKGKDEKTAKAVCKEAEGAGEKVGKTQAEE